MKYLYVIIVILLSGCTIEIINPDNEDPEDDLSCECEDVIGIKWHNEYSRFRDDASFQNLIYVDFRMLEDGRVETWTHIHDVEDPNGSYQAPGYRMRYSWSNVTWERDDTKPCTYLFTTHKSLISTSATSLPVFSTIPWSPYEDIPVAVAERDCTGFKKRIRIGMETEGWGLTHRYDYFDAPL